MPGQTRISPSTDCTTTTATHSTHSTHPPPLSLRPSSYLLPFPLLPPPSPTRPSPPPQPLLPSGRPFSVRPHGSSALALVPTERVDCYHRHVRCRHVAVALRSDRCGRDLVRGSENRNTALETAPPWVCWDVTQPQTAPFLSPVSSCMSLNQMQRQQKRRERRPLSGSLL